jgi:hypothetical protein
MPVELLTRLPVVDLVLDAHAVDLGADLVPYRHHVYRVVNLATAFGRRDPAWLEQIAIAGAFHDLGIWTDRTWDYIEPSVARVTAHLAAIGRSQWTADISTTIREHHKVSTYVGPAHWMAEPFRRADWTDVTCGWRRFGLPWPAYRAIAETWPDDGFHYRLLQLAGSRLKTHPLNPLPMLHR